MDTLTHALSGALLARATAPDPARARITTAARMAAGAFAAAFPDTDFFLAYVSPVAYLTGHRGITHSIFLLPIWALAARLAPLEDQSAAEARPGATGSASARSGSARTSSAISSPRSAR